MGVGFAGSPLDSSKGVVDSLAEDRRENWQTAEVEREQNSWMGKLGKLGTKANKAGSCF